MNYYARGGEAQGIKSIARELASYGRGGDTMLAHINPQEAAMLKAMGGSGTINPHTGLPEFLFGFKVPIVDDVIHGVKSLVQDLGPVATIAGAYFGGPLGAALVGGLQGDKTFDIKRAMMSGALAYGAQNLAEGVNAAASPSADVAAANATSDPIAAMNTSSGWTGTGEANLLNEIPAAGDQSMTSRIGSDIAEKTTSIPEKLETLGSGIKNLVTNQPGAVDAFKSTGATMMNTALPIYGGYAGTVALDEADKMKKEADIANAAYESDLAEQRDRTEKSRLRGIAAMTANPYQFAEGGNVPNLDHMAPGGLSSLQGMRDGYAPATTGIGEIPQFAKGGQPRFLSGGGDGMSDSIPATIEGKQEARLADGEFVIPADVVSHLGNGSSKAGAKQLYSMMDKVRTARTGTKKQGRQINPSKFMPA